MMFLVLAWLLERIFGWRARSHRDVGTHPSVQPPAPTTAELEAAVGGVVEGCTNGCRPMLVRADNP